MGVTCHMQPTNQDCLIGARQGCSVDDEDGLVFIRSGIYDILPYFTGISLILLCLLTMSLLFNMKPLEGRGKPISTFKSRRKGRDPESPKSPSHVL
jgi:hypothetical protein